MLRSMASAGLADIAPARIAYRNTAANGCQTLLTVRRARRPAEAVQWYRIALDRNGSEPAREFLRRRIAECGG